MEAIYVRKLLEDIEKLRKKRYELQRSSLVGRGELMQMLSQNARTAPLWIGPPDTNPSVLVGAIPAPVSMSLKVCFADQKRFFLFSKRNLIFFSKKKNAVIELFAESFRLVWKLPHSSMEYGCLPK